MTMMILGGGWMKREEESVEMGVLLSDVLSQFSESWWLLFESLLIKLRFAMEGALIDKKAKNIFIFKDFNVKKWNSSSRAHKKLNKTLLITYLMEIRIKRESLKENLLNKKKKSELEFLISNLIDDFLMFIKLRMK